MMVEIRGQGSSEGAHVEELVPRSGVSDACANETDQGPDMDRGPDRKQKHTKRAFLEPAPSRNSGVEYERQDFINNRFTLCKCT